MSTDDTIMRTIIFGLNCFALGAMLMAVVSLLVGCKAKENKRREDGPE